MSHTSESPPPSALADAAKLLAAADPAEQSATAVALLARLMGARVAALFTLAGQEIAHEAWWPADEAVRVRHRPYLRGLGLETAASGAPVHTPVPADLGPATVRVERITDGPRTVAVLCTLAPEYTLVSDVALRDGMQLVARALTQRAELATLQAERSRQDRWFKQLDQHIRVLDRERQKFAAIVNQSDIYVFTTDADRVVRWTNRALSSAVACDAGSNWAGQGCDALWDKFEREGRWRCPVAQALDQHRPAHCELLLRVGDAQRPMWATALPIRSPEGRTHEVLVIMQDLSAVGALRRAEERVQTVLALAPVILFAIDADGTVRLSMGRGLHKLGKRSGDSVGKSIWELYAHYPEVLDDLRRAFAGEELVTKSVMGDVAFETNLVPVRDSDGVVTGLIGVSTDISERLRLETELRLAHEMEAAGHLAGAVAHEFNNLLTVIMGHAELIRSRLHDGHPLRHCAEEMQRAGQQGVLLTRRLLTLGRPGEGDAQPIEIGALLRDTADMLRGMLGTRIELAVELCATPAPMVVRADRARLEQALASLIVNARDTMPRGGRLALSADEDGDGSIVITVSHTPVTAAERGTDAVGRTHPPNGGAPELPASATTTPLPDHGEAAMLTLVRAVVRRLGGTVAIESRPAGGAVRLLLPAYAEPTAEAA